MANALDNVMRIRRQQPTRLESFVDASFAYAITLVVIGLGMLVLTGWWWPGILLVIGLAVAAELARRGEMAAAASAFICFATIPLGLALISAIDIPWLPVGTFVLIGLGLVALARRLVV